MKRRVMVVLAVTGVLLGMATLAPASNGPAARGPVAGSLVERAEAQATKSRGGSGGGAGSAGKVGENAANLGSGWAIPLTVFVTGCLLAGALISRNVGAAVGVVLVGVIALIFFTKPQAIVDFASSVGNTIF
jgi:hypothetical protein